MCRSEDLIVIKGLSLRCKVGVSEQERRAEQDVIVDVAIWLDLRRAAVSDRLEDTIDYRTLRDQIETMASRSQFRLIEAMAGRIVDMCLAIPVVEKVKVCVEKPGALRLAKSVAVEITRSRPALAVIEVGSNIAPEMHIPKALSMLMERQQVLATSAFYQTEPIGPHQPAFMNGAWLVRTHMAPAQLKEELLAIELALGRQRSCQKDAPRTIDLDLVLYDQVVCCQAGLTLPHPDLVRPFVIGPILELLEAWPDLRAKVGWILPKTRPMAIGRPDEALTRQLKAMIKGQA